ncbi:hypothetical protein ElyMa_004705000 [Elysia marginata]|uniref:Uncharacterized protein n=1 Tax=Elysia marginata TaxID=1093978 RepID=A0AAV4I8V7_9GAST|nr:hypothetical protein ElyMa_004705000 [Elysia marginata]
MNDQTEGAEAVAGVGEGGEEEDQLKLWLVWAKAVRRKTSSSCGWCGRRRPIQLRVSLGFSSLASAEAT